MSEVLILGNGISRMTFDRFIKEWRGELWGSNKIYIEYGQQLSRLNGHTDVMLNAIRYREENGYRYEIWAGHLGRNLIEGARTFDCPKEFCRDSGSTWIAQALHEGWDRILVCGFDFGGHDIHSPEVVETNKTNWVKRWREIAKRYGLDRVEFIGFDHKPFLLSGEPAAKYWKQYSRGRTHIDDPEYRALVEGLYGIEAKEPREDRIVKVRYLKGPRVGWETEYKESVAMILADRGEVELIRETPEPDSGTEGEDPGTEEAPKKRGRPRKKTIDTIARETMVDDAPLDDMVEEDEDE